MKARLTSLPAVRLIWGKETSISHTPVYSVYCSVNSFYLGTVTLWLSGLSNSLFWSLLLKTDGGKKNWWASRFLGLFYNFSPVFQDLDQLFRLLKSAVSSQSFLILSLSLRKLTQGGGWKVFTQVILEFVVLLLLFSRCHVWLFVIPWTTACQVLCLPLSSGVCSNSCPLSQCCYLTISSSAASFSNLSQHQSFPMSQFFTSAGQSIGASAFASVLTMNLQDWLPLGLTALISLQSKGLLTVFSSTKIWKSQFFGAQPSLVQLSHL